MFTHSLSTSTLTVVTSVCRRCRMLVPRLLPGVNLNLVHHWSRVCRATPELISAGTVLVAAGSCLSRLGSRLLPLGSCSPLEPCSSPMEHFHPQNPLWFKSQ
ncbi:hypothetical protein AHAS_Ahas13G0032900 [Arachis hypogaea]